MREASAQKILLIKSSRAVKRYHILMLVAILISAGFDGGIFTAWMVTTQEWQPVGIYPASNGNLWVAEIFGLESFELTSGAPVYNPSENVIALIAPNGSTLWSMGGFAVPHSIVQMPNGDLLVTDTEHDQVVEVAYPSGSIVWNWQPALINWTQVNPAWGPTYYFNNPVANDWTHVNDAVWYNHTTWLGVLISLRNWNLVVEVNYTADIANPNQASHIVWWYGDYDNSSVLNHQHGPTYDANGNIWIADSDNQRVIAVNYTTKQVFWSYENDLGWVRGAQPLPNGDVLISGTDKVIEVTPDKQVVWSYSTGIVNAFAAVRLPNGNTVISNNFGSSILWVSPSGTLVNSIGFPVVLWIPTAVAFPALLIPFVRAAASPKRTGRLRDRMTRRLIAYEICGLCLALVFTIALPWILCGTQWMPFLPNSWR
jgi:hypothetical protein